MILAEGNSAAACLQFPHSQNDESRAGDGNQEPDESQEESEDKKREDDEKRMQADFGADDARRQEGDFQEMKNTNRKEGRNNLGGRRRVAESSYDTAHKHCDDESKVRNKIKNCSRDAQQKRVLDVEQGKQQSHHDSLEKCDEKSTAKITTDHFIGPLQVLSHSGSAAAGNKHEKPMADLGKIG